VGCSPHIRGATTTPATPAARVGITGGVAIFTQTQAAGTAAATLIDPPVAAISAPFADGDLQHLSRGDGKGRVDHAPTRTVAAPSGRPVSGQVADAARAS
jgi:hypothetical protein